MAFEMNFGEILCGVREFIKNKLDSLPFHIFGETIDTLRAADPVEGLYIITDENGKTSYVGMSKDIRQRLIMHVHGPNDLASLLLERDGFSRNPSKLHRCKCGEPIPCLAGPLVDTEDARTQARDRIKNRILTSFRVAILRYKVGEHVFGLSELEKLVQYTIPPAFGMVQLKGPDCVPITQYVQEHPIPGGEAR